VSECERENTKTLADTHADHRSLELLLGCFLTHMLVVSWHARTHARTHARLQTDLDAAVREQKQKALDGLLAEQQESLDKRKEKKVLKVYRKLKFAGA
jgi:hypothetical protein